jgi:hypothetical protein
MGEYELPLLQPDDQPFFAQSVEEAHFIKDIVKCPFGNLFVKRYCDGMLAEFCGLFVIGMAAFLMGNDLFEGVQKINNLVAANLPKLWHLPV